MKNKAYIISNLKTLRLIKINVVYNMKRLVNAVTGLSMYSADEIAEAQSMADWIDEQIKKMEGEGETLYPKTPDEQMILPGFEPETQTTCTCDITSLMRYGCNGACRGPKKL